MIHPTTLSRKDVLLDSDTTSTPRVGKVDLKSHPPIRLLVLGRDPAFAQGGIAAFVATQLRRLSDAVSAEPLWIGRKASESVLGTLLRMLGDTRHLRAKLQENDYDVVQLNVSMVKRSLLREFFFCREVLRSGRHRLVIVFHGWDPNVARTIARSKILQSLFERSFARSDRIFVLSERFARALEELGVNSSAIHVLPQAFDDSLFSDLRSPPRNKDKNVLFMSRLIPEKGALELISAFRSGAHEKWPGWTLTIAGDGPQRASVEKEILRNTCSDRIRFAGYVRGNEKKELLRNASVFALPTRYNEGLPISIVEAMSAGCALLCTNVAGLADIVKDKVHGAVIHEGTAESIAAGLTRLLTDEELLLNAQRNCHLFAWEKLAATSVVAELERHIVDVAG